MEKDRRDAESSRMMAVEQLYESITEEPSWRSFLDLACEILGADLGSFVVESRSVGFPDRMKFVSSGDGEKHSAEIGAMYEFGDFGADTPDEALCRTSLAALANGPGNSPRIDQSLSLIIDVDPRTKAHFGLWRYEGRPLFEDADRQWFRSLIPSVRRAMRIFMRYSNVYRERGVYATVVDQIGVGVALVDPDGNIMTTNAIAREIVGASDEIEILNGVLTVRDPRLNRLLHENIRASAEAQTMTPQHHGRPISIERRESLLPLTAIVHSGPNFHPVSAPLRRTAVVVLRDPDRRAAVSPRVVAQLFRLTPAEAALAAHISQGQSLDEAAEALGIRRNTARSQLQSIFQRTGASRQSELVRLILSSVATLST